MPSQAEEEVNQLTYVQKHLPNLLNLLAETAEENSNNKVINVHPSNKFLCDISLPHVKRGIFALKKYPCWKKIRNLRPSILTSALLKE